VVYKRFGRGAQSAFLRATHEGTLTKIFTKLITTKSEGIYNGTNYYPGTQEALYAP
jgi:hypothetical protein